HAVEGEQNLGKALIAQVVAKGPPREYKVTEGRTVELLARVNEQYPNPKDPNHPQPGEVKISEIEQFIREHYNPTPPAEGGAAPPQQTWQQLVEEVAKQWSPKTYVVQRGRLQTLVDRIAAQYPDVPVTEIGDFINQNYQVAKGQRHLSSEEVENIKELVSQVGALEFRVLANNRVDKEAIDRAKLYFDDAQKDDKKRNLLASLAQQGQPPPMPPGPNPDGSYTTPLGKFTYRWVELGRS